MIKNFEIEEDIYQDLVKFYGRLFDLPPLTAKIYAYLIFDFDKEGFTFEEIVDIFSASKSSVSSSINLLLNQKLVKDITKIDERRRYFIINDDYLKFRFTQIIERLTTELDILDRLQEFRGEEDEKYLEYRSLMSANITNIKNSLSKF